MRYAALLLAIAATIVHLFAAAHYGYFRDELYFIACAKHLAWGYVDQPPLVAIAAWLSAPFGYALLVLRLLPALAAGGTVFVACMLTRKLGGNRFVEIAAGIAVFLLPANLFLGSTLTTTSFEPLTWTLAIYLFVCILETSTPALWYWLMATVVFAFYAKYSILLLILALVVALVLTGQRQILRNRHLLFAFGIGALAVLPNVAWQVAHGLPMLEVLHNDVADRHAYNSGLIFQTASMFRNAGLFLIEQLAFTNPLLVPVWIGGLVALLWNRHFARMRFIGLAYLLVIAAAVLLEAKSYYIAGMYPALIAAGMVLYVSGKLRYLFCVGLPAVAAIFAPFAFPLLSPMAFITYEADLGIPQARENPPRLVQPLFAEEFGWRELAQHVAAVYTALPPSERARTAVFADNYGDAGALDLYGPALGLPPALSGQNSYYLWSQARLQAMRPQPDTFIAVGATQAELLRATFRSVQMVDTYLHPYRWSAEGPAPIFLCRHPVEPLGQVFLRFRWYGA